MKKVFLLLVACAFITAQGFSQDAKTQENENPNAPVIAFVEEMHDFGTVPYKGMAECEFVFSNTGKEPLIIQDCPSTCGCTVPACPKDKPIKAGEKSTIKVKYNNTNIPGPFNKQFTVRSNARNAVVKITIKGVIADAPKTASN
jgi:hypothetical protein